MMNIDSKRNWQDFPINIKFKLAALWASVSLLYLYGDYFELYVPEKVKGLLSGNNILNTPNKLLMAASLLAIACLMVALSVIAKAAISRWLSIIFGCLFSLVTFLVMLSPLSSWRLFYNGYALLETVLTIYIVWIAYKWPTESEKNPTNI